MSKKFLVVSTSLNPASRSRILAGAALSALNELDESGDCELLDLQSVELPFCDGDQAYGHPNVARVQQMIKDASGIIMSVPIYNFASGAAAKNLIELTGRTWTEKVVGFLCAAGGKSSYMSVMSLANSLMLDFRSIIIPGFVYADKECFDGDKIVDRDVVARVDRLAEQLVRVTNALH